MTGNLEKEFAVPLEIGKLVLGRLPEGDAAEDEGPGIIGQRLGTILTLFMNETDRLQLFQLARANANLR
jgi:hypothetical protein